MIGIEGNREIIEDKPAHNNVAIAIVLVYDGGGALSFYNDLYLRLYLLKVVLYGIVIMKEGKFMVC